MSDIIFSLKDNRTYLIKNYSAINARKQMKFSIILSSLPVTYEVQKDDLVISFLENDVFVLQQQIKEVAEALLNIDDAVKYDEVVQDIIRENEEHESKTLGTRQSLVEIKNGNVSDSPEFKEFCETCDSFLKINLREYQYKAAYMFVKGNGGFEFSVPGSGKTIISYTAYAYMLKHNEIQKMLVIGPLNSFNAWFEEYITCFGIEPDFENLASQSLAQCKIYLSASGKNHRAITFINYDKVRNLVPEIKLYLRADSTLLINDEAHKVKNPDAAVTSALLDISKYATKRILLTGTPMPNGYEDLFSLMHIFSPYDEIIPFNYGQLKKMSSGEVSEQQIDTVKESIYPYYSRISKKFLVENGELTNPVVHHISCDMDEVQLDLYMRLNDFFAKTKDEVDEDILVYFKKALVIRKMQLSANPALLQKGILSSMDELRELYAPSADESSVDDLLIADRKITDYFATSEISKIVKQFTDGRITNKNMKAVEIACELVSQGKQVLIWDVFVDNMSSLKSMLEHELQEKVELINGSVNTTDRQTAIARFRNRITHILIANPATLAESISLHRVCQYAIYVNRNFNAAQFIQSKDRIHRINMPEGTTATYYFLQNTNSIDEVVNDRLEFKEQRMLKILDSDDIEIGGSEMEDSSIMSMSDVDEGIKR